MKGWRRAFAVFLIATAICETREAHSQTRGTLFDVDANCVIDFADFRGMSPCLLGPASSDESGNCAKNYDSNADGDVDLEDFAAVQRSFGPVLGLVPRYRWSMPDRFGLDANSDGLIDYFTSPEAVNPSSWRVDFNACSSCGSPVSFSWHVNDEFAGESMGCKGFFWSFPSKGRYEVSLTIQDQGGLIASQSQQVVIRDWLIVGLGDSYASGEGTPDFPIVPAALDAHNMAVVRLEEAQAALRTAQDALELARMQFDAQIPRLNETLARLDSWLQAVTQLADACRNPLSSACRTAIANEQNRRSELLNSLNQIGLGHLIGNADGIRTAVAELRAQAQAVVDLAQATVEEAGAALAQARDVLDDAASRLKPKWQDELCHRSAFSGQALAALELERSDPRTSVTFVHLACSGATVDGGLLGQQVVATDSGPIALRSQLDQLEALVQNREIDAVMISIGGNDVHFAQIVEGCIMQEPCFKSPATVAPLPTPALDAICNPIALGPFSNHCEEYFHGLLSAPSSAELFEVGVSELPDALGRLGSAMRERIPNIRPESIVVTAYPNISKNDNGASCAFELSALSTTAPGISQPEMTWAGQDLTPTLNGLLETACAENGWIFVAPIFEAFSTHGYCADEEWFVRLQNTFQIQGDVRGAFHPNQDGFAIIGHAIADSLHRILFMNEE